MFNFFKFFLLPPLVFFSCLLLICWAVKSLLNFLLNVCKIQYEGGPPLTNNDYCMACLIDGAQSVVFADSYRDRRTLMRDLASDVLAGKRLDGTYYVSKTW